MTVVNFKTEFTSTYKIKGQAVEQEYRFFKTGEIVKADNLPADRGCDLGNCSIKSARATICKGTDLQAHLATDKATEFVYLTQTKLAYTMTKAEYIEFVAIFGTVDKDSAKNGGKTKLRLKSESKALLDYLAERA